MTKLQKSQFKYNHRKNIEISDFYVEAVNPESLKTLGKVTTQIIKMNPVIDNLLFNSYFRISGPVDELRKLIVEDDDELWLDLSINGHSAAFFPIINQDSIRNCRDEEILQTMISRLVDQNQGVVLKNVLDDQLVFKAALYQKRNHGKTKWVADRDWTVYVTDEQVAHSINHRNMKESVTRASISSDQIHYVSVWGRNNGLMSSLNATSLNRTALLIGFLLKPDVDYQLKFKIGDFQGEYPIFIPLTDVITSQSVIGFTQAGYSFVGHTNLVSVDSFFPILLDYLNPAVFSNNQVFDLPYEFNLLANGQKVSRKTGVLLINNDLEIE